MVYCFPTKCKKFRTLTNDNQNSKALKNVVLGNFFRKKGPNPRKNFCPCFPFLSTKCKLFVVLMQNTSHYFLYCHKVGHAWSHIKLGFYSMYLHTMILEWNKVHICRVSHNYLDWAKYQNRHSSKNIYQVMNLFFCQNAPLMGQSFWQNTSKI